MFAKFINETKIEKAPRYIHVGDTTFVMPSAEQYAAGEYYEVEEAVKPENKEFYHLIAKYELQVTEESSYTIKKTDEEGNTTEDVFQVKMKKIVQRWDYVKDERPDYSELIVGFIREKYSINDELAIQRQCDNSEEKKAEFDEYNAFCDACKAKAKEVLARYDEAQ